MPAGLASQQVHHPPGGQPIPCCRHLYPWQAPNTATEGATACRVGLSTGQPAEVVPTRHERHAAPAHRRARWLVGLSLAHTAWGPLRRWGEQSPRGIVRPWRLHGHAAVAAKCTPRGTSPQAK